MSQSLCASLSLIRHEGRLRHGNTCMVFSALASVAGDSRLIAAAERAWPMSSDSNDVGAAFGAIVTALEVLENRSD